MKIRNWLLTLGTLALFSSFPSSTEAALVFAKTIAGEALCAKCELKETEKCQIAIREKAGDASIIYYATDNQIARTFFPKVCKEVVKVTAVGTVRERDGHRQITLKDIWPARP